MILGLGCPFRPPPWPQETSFASFATRRFLLFEFTRPSVVVLEGLDGTGKSTVIDHLKGLLGGFVLFSHSPSGHSDNAIGRAVYDLTESKAPMTILGRQFLHLAAHAEEYRNWIWPTILRGGSVVMDRNWLSTLAYGDEIFYPMGAATALHLVRLPTCGVDPDVIFYFGEPFVEDPHNTPELVSAYERWIREVQRGEICESVPISRPSRLASVSAETGQTADLILGRLEGRGILRSVKASG